MEGLLVTTGAGGSLEEEKEGKAPWERERGSCEHVWHISEATSVKEDGKVTEV